MNELTIAVGSQNPAKLGPVQRSLPNVNVVGIDVPSGVSDQPRSEKETRQGAMNRAKAVLGAYPDALIGIGLEGGVVLVEDRLFLTNWGALHTKKGNTYLAAGLRIPLPDEVAKEVIGGDELGPVMDRYTKKQDTRKSEGAVGTFTNGRILRGDMFHQIVEALVGQWEREESLAELHL